MGKPAINSTSKKKSHSKKLQCERITSVLIILWAVRLCCQVSTTKITSHTRLHIGHQYSSEYALIHQINAFPSHSQRSPPAENSTGQHSSELDMSVGDFTMVQQANTLPLRPLGQTKHQAEGLHEWLLLPFFFFFFCITDVFLSHTVFVLLYLHVSLFKV